MIWQWYVAECLFLSSTIECEYCAFVQSHSSIQKAGMVAGTRVRLLPTRAEDDYALRSAVLEAAIEEDIAAGLLPFYVVATIGTTSSCAVDSLPEMGKISQKHNLWCAILYHWSYIWAADIVC